MEAAKVQNWTPRATEKKFHTAKYLFEKLSVDQLIMKFLPFVEPSVLQPCPKESDLKKTSISTLYT
jgi:hypothetical protein